MYTQQSTTSYQDYQFLTLKEVSELAMPTWTETDRSGHFGTLILAEMDLYSEPCIEGMQVTLG